VPNKQTAFAKINLCLHVTGQRDDGYHLLDSLVVFADYGDDLTFTNADDFKLTIDGPFGAGLSDGPENLIARAATLLGGGGADVHLLKNLPVASGIGGGSADAAGALRGLSALWNTDFPDDRGVSLGADVPVCLKSRATRMQGIGDQLTDIHFLPPLPAILVNSGHAVSTPTIFNALDRKDNSDIGALPTLPMTFNDAIKYIATLRNDLQKPAIDQVSEISDVCNALTKSGAALARMSGSGATCFGLYPDAQQAQYAAQIIQCDNPNWWVQPVTLNARG
jgi:4-diphosphocytidyl-2-C-methyl-D-erythritol kinase